MIRFRFSFNGKEKDPETVSTSGGTQDYGMRIYNPSLGRFLSIDPLEKNYPHLSTFQYASNNPITFIDMDGAESRETATPATDTKLAKDNTAPFINVEAKVAMATKAMVPKPMPSIQAWSLQSQKEAMAFRAYHAQENYFRGMNDFNRSGVTSPVVQEVAKSWLIAGTGGAIGGLIPRASAGLRAAYNTLGKNSDKIANFVLSGATNASANFLGQAVVNQNFKGIDYADVGISFILNKPTFSNALIGAGLSAGIDVKGQGDPFFFGLGGATKTTGQIALDFTTNFSLNLLNNKVSNLNVGSSLPFVTNSLTGAAQNSLNFLSFPNSSKKPQVDNQ